MVDNSLFKWYLRSSTCYVDQCWHVPANGRQVNTLLGANVALHNACGCSGDDYHLMPLKPRYG
eukprot:729778-Amphidinium_carterae.1